MVWKWSDVIRSKDIVLVLIDCIEWDVILMEETNLWGSRRQKSG